MELVIVMDRDIGGSESVAGFGLGCGCGKGACWVDIAVVGGKVITPAGGGSVGIGIGEDENVSVTIFAVEDVDRVCGLNETSLGVVVDADVKEVGNEN
jgi:hypothetical protein